MATQQVPDPIDRRTGKPYVGTDFGHGLDCVCEDCVRKVMSDMVEAGIIEITGIDETGDPYMRFPEENHRC